MDGQTSLTNVSEEMFDGSLGFEDIEDEDVEGNEESQEAQPEAEKTKEEPKEEPDFLKIRYNKADKSLTRAEAVELAQKGMNYDKVLAELDSYRTGPIGKAIKSFADQAGLSVEKYAEMMAQQADAAAEKKALDELREKWPDAPDDLLAEYARMQRGENQRQAQTAEEAKRQKAWEEALQEYPEIKPDSVPKDVHDAVADGKSPLEALREHELMELRAKVAELTSAKEAKQKQADNRARSSGSLASMGGKDDDGFMSDFA